MFLDGYFHVCWLIYCESLVAPSANLSDFSFSGPLTLILFLLVLLINVHGTVNDVVHILLHCLQNNVHTGNFSVWPDVTWCTSSFCNDRSLGINPLYDSRNWEVISAIVPLYYRLFDLTFRTCNKMPYKKQQNIHCLS